MFVPERESRTNTGCLQEKGNFLQTRPPDNVTACITNDFGSETCGV
jgi:hypothetical protein